MNFNASYTGLRTDLLKYITIKDCSVLDVGCSTGANGKWLLDSSIARTVTGIEYDKSMAEIAELHYDKVYNINLNTDHQVFKDIGSGTFDYILLGDILEHLVDPWSAMKSFAKMLKPDGRAILSIPNVGHIDTFIHLYIKRRWPYNNRGIYDRTHLRFFTWTNIQELVHCADLELLEMRRKYRYRDAMDSKFPFYGAMLKTLFKDLYTFQYVVVCAPIIDQTS